MTIQSKIDDKSATNKIKNTGLVFEKRQKLLEISGRRAQLKAAPGLFDEQKPVVNRPQAFEQAQPKHEPVKVLETQQAAKEPRKIGGFNVMEDREFWKNLFNGAKSVKITELLKSLIDKLGIADQAAREFIGTAQSLVFEYRGGFWDLNTIWRNIMHRDLTVIDFDIVIFGEDA